MFVMLPEDKGECVVHYQGLTPAREPEELHLHWVEEVYHVGIGFPTQELPPRVIHQMRNTSPFERMASKIAEKVERDILGDELPPGFHTSWNPTAAEDIESAAKEQPQTFNVADLPCPYGGPYAREMWDKLIASGVVPREYVYPTIREGETIPDKHMRG